MMTMQYRTAERLLKLIAHVRQENISTPQIETILDVRRSCANGYLALLVKDKVLVVHRHAIRRSVNRDENKTRCNIYKLNENDDVVQRFIDKMQKVMDDSTPQKVKKQAKLPAPDPLLAMFFSMAVV